MELLTEVRPTEAPVNRVTSSAPFGRNQHDCTSHSWFGCRPHSPRRCRHWAPSVAKRHRLTKSNWCTVILLHYGTGNVLYPGTAGRVASGSLDAGRHDLLDLDDARRKQAQAFMNRGRLHRLFAPLVTKYISVWQVFLSDGRSPSRPYCFVV